MPLPTLPHTLLPLPLLSRAAAWRTFVQSDDAQPDDGVMGDQMLRLSYSTATDGRCYWRIRPHNGSSASAPLSDPHDGL